MPTPRYFDVAIYGSGFAGYAVARSALAGGLSVLVVERGPRDDARRSLEHARVASPWEAVRTTGLRLPAELKPYENVPRYFGLGGTSEIWSGKWRALDAIDHERRVGNRRWPFDDRALASATREVSGWFDVEPNSRVETLAVQDACRSANLRVVPIRLEHEPTRLVRWWDRLESESRLTIVTGAEPSFHVGGNSVAAVRLRGAGETDAEIQARHHVIAAGGIESARLVHRLASQATGAFAARLGGYMDHPKGKVGRLAPSRNVALLEEVLGAELDGHILALGLPEDELRSSGLGNHTVFLTGGKSRRWPFSRRQPVTLTINADQFPESDNQIELDDLAQVRWRISARTRRDIDRFLDTMLPRLESLFGKVERSDWIELVGASHPAGCSPFADDPNEFELYPDGRLSCLTNAYCVSSAAFPVAGSANPTLTVAALGQRLGAMLSAQGTHE